MGPFWLNFSTLFDGVLTAKFRNPVVPKRALGRADLHHGRRMGPDCCFPREFDVQQIPTGIETGRELRIKLHHSNTGSPMLKFLSDQAQSRFRELQEKLASFSISPQEQTELADLVAKGQKKFQERDSVVVRLKAEIAEYALQASDLFSAAELRAVVRPQAAPSTAGATGAGSRRRGPRAAKEAPTVLIRAKVGKGAGAPSKYHQGQKLPPVVPRNFKALDDGRHLSENLARHFTEAGRAYFATAEGKAELARFEQYIRSGRSAG